MNELEFKANSFLLSLDNWLKANKLHLNIDKTCYSVFSPNKIPVPTVTVKINDVKITCVKECKYLSTRLTLRTLGLLILLCSRHVKVLILVPYSS